MSHHLGQPERGTAVAEQLLGTLAAHGVERLWFCSGSELVPLQEAAALMRARGEAAPLLCTATHEHVAISAAMGESAVTGRPVAVVAHADLGPLNFGAELHTALRGGYPVLIIGGYPATAAQYRTAQAFWNQQRWDHGEVLRQYTQWDHRLQAHEDVGTVVARALQVACSEPTGPVFLSVPAELLAAPTSPGSVVGSDRLGIARHGAGPLDLVRAVADRLLHAEEPLVITERIGKDAEAVRLLGELVERHAISCRTTRFRMSLPTEHPSQIGAVPVVDADAIVVVEHHVPWIPATGAPRDDAWIAAVGQDVLASEIPIHEFPADVRVVAAPREFLRALLDELDARADEPEVARVRALRNTRIAARAQSSTLTRQALVSEALAAPTLSHAAIGAAVDEYIGEDEILVDELGDTHELVRRTQPGTLFHNGGSALGWASSGAVGIGLASGRPVVVTSGDGGHLFGSPGAALWAQRAYDVPVVTVVANNGGYRTGTGHVDAAYPDGEVMNSGDYTGGQFSLVPDHAAEARGAGAVGFTVHTPDELRAALREARVHSQQHRRPVVIDALIPDHRGVVPSTHSRPPHERQDA